MTYRLLLYVSLLLLLLSGCGSGDDGVSIQLGGNTSDQTTVSFDFVDFKAVEVGGPFRLDILQGSEFSVEITVDADVVDDLDVNQLGDRLRIGFRSNTNVQTSILEAVVVMPELDALIFAGATSGVVSGFEGSLLNLDMAGATFLEALNLTYDSVFIRAVGASTVILDEIAPIAVADTQLVGASSATLRLMDNATITGHLLGASAVFYFGSNVNNQVTTDISSTITRVGD